jgi:membrane protein DedA with SNARE-associated domain
VTSGLVQVVLDGVHQYGYVAVFIYMVLETSFLLHFVPSELVVPFAASELVHDPVSFALFVADTTAGATVGSLLAYVVFGREGRAVLERYGHVIHLSETQLDRSEAVFARYGESAVFWGRLLPLLRALISIPAGLAGMDLRKFVAYSAAGALLFNTGLTYLVYTGAGTRSPLDIAVERLGRWVTPGVVYVQTHVELVAVVGGVLVLSGVVVWLARDRIRRNPETAKHVALHLVRLVGLAVGGLFLFGALSSPHRSFVAVTWAWNDPRFLVGLGFSEQVALVLTAGVVVVLSLAVYEVGQVVRIAHLQAAGRRLRERYGRR